MNTGLILSYRISQSLKFCEMGCVSFPQNDVIFYDPRFEITQTGFNIFGNDPRLTVYVDPDDKTNYDIFFKKNVEFCVEHKFLEKAFFFHAKVEGYERIGNKMLLHIKDVSKVVLARKEDYLL